MDLETERVFKKHWLYAGPLSKLREPGDFFTGMLFGLAFVVVLDESRRVRAYHNLCTHRAAAVATGEGRLPVCGDEHGGAPGLRFECPYHAWRFDTAGRFRGCRISNGLAGIRNFSPDASSLAPIHVDTWGPLVFIHLGEETPPPLAQVMGAGGQQLAAEGLADPDWQWYKRIDYPMACNWKAMVDNYQDGNYHGAIDWWGVWQRRRRTCAAASNGSIDPHTRALTCPIASHCQCTTATRA